MAAAYNAVDSGQIDLSPELNILAHIDRYSYGALYGRPLRTREVRKFNLADSVRFTYESRNKSESWASWARENPEANQLLNRAMIAAAKEDGR